MIERKDCNDKIRGCLIGGAVGDALGYPIEFYTEEDISEEYGTAGITAYKLDSKSRKALISDDTQMTLFTANGILLADTRSSMTGLDCSPSDYVRFTYSDWLETQEGHPYQNFNRHYSWLTDIPELNCCRAPGNTCLTALEAGGIGSIEEPVNHSKGCGGIMRVAPLGLFYNYVDIYVLDREGAEIAAITHGHSLGYMPAAFVTHIINSILYADPAMPLIDIIHDASTAMKEIFAGDKHLKKMLNLVNLAVSLTENNSSDLENIHKLGEGWVAEETLAIAIYCSVKYQNDFSKAIITAVNHKGDSDSTGAVTGNILGALLGYKAIDDKWTKNLELKDTILEIADDLTLGCPMSEYGIYRDPVWIRKYIEVPQNKKALQ